MSLEPRERPSKFAEWILKRLLFKVEREEKLGDFLEVFCYLSNRGGIRKAKFWYWKQIFIACPAFISNFFTGVVKCSNMMF